MYFFFDQSPSRLLALAMLGLAFAGCGLPDDDPALAFRTSEVGDDFNGADGLSDPPVELPECIVVTTPTEGATSGSHEQPPSSDDFGNGPTSDGGTTDGGDPTDGGDDRAPPPGGGASTTGDDGLEGGDDISNPPDDPTTLLACPGEGETVTVHAGNLAEAVVKCDRYYGHCCESLCAAYDLVPADSACAMDASDAYPQSYDDISPNQGGYACGCDCEIGFISG